MNESNSRGTNLFGYPRCICTFMTPSGVCIKCKKPNRQYEPTGELIWDSEKRHFDFLGDSTEAAKDYLRALTGTMTRDVVDILDREWKDKIRSIIPQIHGGGNARRLLEGLLSDNK